MQELKSITPPNPSTNQDQSIRLGEDQPETSLHGRRDSKSRGNERAPILLRTLVRAIHHYPSLSAFLTHARSFAWRIGIERKVFVAAQHPRGNKTWLLDLGPHAEPDASGRVVRCKRTDCRRQDIENFSSKWPMATMSDEWIFLQAWNAGVESALRNFDTSEKETRS
jgi:hypothetical protein